MENPVQFLATDSTGPLHQPPSPKTNKQTNTLTKTEEAQPKSQTRI